MLDARWMPAGWSLGPRPVFMMSLRGEVFSEGVRGETTLALRLRAFASLLCHIQLEDVFALYCIWRCGVVKRCNGHPVQWHLQCVQCAA